VNEDDARRVLLVRAVEIEDSAEALLTREDRQAATAAGLADGFDPSRNGDERFLAQRAAFAFGRLTTRFPLIEQACRASQWPRWLGWAVPGVALLLGVATNEVGNGKRLNLIAFPLIGMLAWNALVYLWLIVSALRRRRPSRVGAWIARWAGPRIDEHQPLGRALARFGRDWIGAAGRLTTARVSRSFHLGAAAFAIGVVANLYLRALGVEYRAGWESTFLQAPTVHALLGIALGPASAVTGIALPTPEHLAGLRWSEGPGEVAAPWIHLYAATAALFIVAPRLLLAMASGGNVARLKRGVPVPGREDFHVRRLLRAAQGGAAEVRVLPYGFTPPDTTRRTLAELLTAALGDGTRTQVDAPIPYGGEEEWLARARLTDGLDHLVILFNLGSTPEAENHGALVAGVQKLLAGRGTALSIVLDEAAFRERSGGGDRLDVRRQAWERMLATTGEHPFAADLSQARDANLVRRLESALVRSPTLGLKR
jgi:hypothetical protein